MPFKIKLSHRRFKMSKIMRFNYYLVGIILGIILIQIFLR